MEISPSLKIKDQLELVEQLFSGGIDPYFENRKLIRFSMENNPIALCGQCANVPMISVFKAKPEYFPKFHLFSRSHYLKYSRSMYGSVMNYEDFCEMEDQLANIVNQYLEDRRNNWLIMMDEPFLMGNMRGYGNEKSIIGSTTWITWDKTGWEDMMIVDWMSKNKHDKYI